MKKSRLLISLVLLLPLWLHSCNYPEVFSEFHSIKNAQWERSDPALFEVQITDSLARYDIFFEIRNNNNYDFRNLWLFIHSHEPGGEVHSDTLNIELADLHGKWKGKGLSLYTLAYLYRQDVTFPRSGTYRYTIQQGMRKDPVEGISDIGMKVLKKAE